MVRRERRGGEQVGGENFSIYSSPSLGATKVLACSNRGGGVGSANGRQGLSRTDMMAFGQLGSCQHLQTFLGAL